MIALCSLSNFPSIHNNMDRAFSIRTESVIEVRTRLNVHQAIQLKEALINADLINNSFWNEIIAELGVELSQFT